MGSGLLAVTHHLAVPLILLCTHSDYHRDRVSAGHSNRHGVGEHRCERCLASERLRQSRAPVHLIQNRWLDHVHPVGGHHALEAIGKLRRIRLHLADWLFRTPGPHRGYHHRRLLRHSTPPVTSR